MRPLTTILMVAPILVACEEIPDPEFELGRVIGEPCTVSDRDDCMRLDFVSDTVGVHPDRSIIFDVNNPFRAGISTDTKFAMINIGPIPQFYAFGTALVGEPTGENQFFTAEALQLVWEEEIVPPEDLALARKLAISGYQTVLDEFPGAVTFDETGRDARDLMARTVQGILDLGAVPEGGWRLAVGPDGEPIAVQSGVTEDD